MMPIGLSEVYRYLDERENTSPRISAGMTCIGCADSAVLDSPVRRAILFAPLIVFFGLCAALVIYQSSGRDADYLRLVTAGSGSFTFFFYAGLLVLSLFSISLPTRALGGLALPLALFVVLAALDLRTKDRPSSGGFISLDYNYKTLWLIPGIFVIAPLKNMMFDSVPTGPHLTSTSRMVIRIQGALQPPDRSIVVAGTVSREGLSIDWRLLSRLDATGNIDGSFAPRPPTLPDLDLIRSRPDGSGLISWRDGSAIKIATVALDGTITRLFDLSPTTTELVSAQHLTDAAMDAGRRLLLAGVFEKASPAPGYADVNYPLARFDANGRLDPTFTLLELPRIFGSGGVVLAPTDGILVDYVEIGGAHRLRRLLPDGRPDTVFETGLEQSIERLQHGMVRAAAFDQEDRVLVGLKNESLDEVLLVRLGADGRPLPSQQATIPGNMGDVGTVVSHPDESVFVIMGNKKVGRSEFKLPWYPVLLHFTPDLQLDEQFNLKTAPLGREFGEMKVLALRDNGGIIVSLSHPERESCVLYLARDGSVEKRIQF